jgi:hypothetical protein
MKGNEPAFPNIDYERTGMSYATPVINGGMSLLDYMAEQALQGILADPWTSTETFSQVAEEAYQYADVMLEARGANNGK